MLVEYVSSFAVNLKLKTQRAFTLGHNLAQIHKECLEFETNSTKG